MEHLKLTEQHSRGIAYRRNQRNTHIRRKKKLSKSVYGFDWYEKDGMYDKGKIHCSCIMCTYSKTYDYPRIKDYISNDKFVQQLKDLYNVS